MPRLTLYIKPTCTTCRQALAKLDACDVEYETVDLFETELTVDLLRGLCRKLGVSPREILRAKDPAFAQNDLGSGKHSEDQILALMVKHPGLIQRPIVVQGKKAVLARPVDKLDDLIA
jgi:arsenate reductase (glutaredoxin)